MSKKLMISCDEATAICDKSQYGEASFWEKLKLNLHLLMCKHCRGYSKQNHLITKIVGKYLHAYDSSKHLTIEEKTELEKKLREKI